MATFLELGIPSSTSTVSVAAINLGALLLSSVLPAGFFLEPLLPGNESFRPPVYAFFIEHRITGKRLMFDLGLQKNHPSAVQELLTLWRGRGCYLEPADKDLFERLQDGGVDPATINTVIWSHGHIDHTGEMSKFPTTTELVIGPGLDTRTFPTTPESHLLESDLAGRKVTELDLNDFALTIGDYEALDYFSDGSLYILNSPGVSTGPPILLEKYSFLNAQAGHISILARVTSTSFVLLGADTCHHIGQVRPTTELLEHYPCPFHSIASRTTPLLPEHPGYGHAEPEVARTTIAKLAKLDMSPDILVIIAHDATVPAVIDEFPEILNKWKEKGWKEKLMWAVSDKDFPALKT
ncbi:uncharacterized protein EV420DRAFT_1634763 [Desarmillaria tabescens]|uniref:Metallo-beta-lactamase domain-containing protein n=1 Tax=Armillaria tabescens TaxID=1929756 RepID=A0AA39NR79_ARMTA|nr:uncharacterized protein EV420DRAFT_1634763 [Desarmillaria tabescens]KAK0470335.1 hypothetical protein EV420DRAFT_1634763 [Desarmillaria tabescens]